MWRFLGRQTGSEPSFVGQFKNFVAPHGSIIDLAVYGAFYTVASALVDNIILPVMGFFSVGAQLSKLAITLKEPVAGPHGEAVREAVILNIGSFLQAFLNFIIVALIFFAIARLCSTICQFTYRFFGKSFKTNSPRPIHGLPPDRVIPHDASKMDDKNQEELLIEIRDLLRQMNTKRRISVK
jgi:large conductance mechanosensitive channel